MANIENLLRADNILHILRCIYCLKAEECLISIGGMSLHFTLASPKCPVTK